MTASSHLSKWHDMCYVVTSLTCLISAAPTSKWKTLKGGMFKFFEKESHPSLVNTDKHEIQTQDNCR